MNTARYFKTDKSCRIGRTYEDFILFKKLDSGCIPRNAPTGRPFGK
ncbi:hypothetical protein HMPREF0322_04482 [Desulfitobacterium hafniense DP7]|uniref:Uncharacterized protein n=1 Tax=Desulfitobacterium hafniense DP7 TaxID=537010 RepID=G9XU24_DESHA|nr:hypothetical protein HMPREF0322_04482 [Desulfitobacterium hafniense DP7]